MPAWVGPCRRGQRGTRPAAELLDARQLAAAAAGQDALFAAWQALGSVALQDLALRAQQLPQLIGYARPRPPVALALAHRLYQDATRASELVALNDAPQPLFMPIIGKAMAARLVSHRT